LTTDSALILSPAARKRGLWVVKPLYFLIFGSMGALFPFISIYYYNLGLSGTEIGLINTISPLVGALSNVAWGMLNDRFGKVRLFLGLASLGTIGTVLLLSLAPDFVWILPAAALLSLFSNPMNSLLDSTTLRLLGERANDYGRYRLWGSCGFIFTTTITGFLLEARGMGWMFWMYAGCILLFFLMNFGLPPQPPPRLGVSIWRGMGTMVHRPAWLVFAISLFLTWSGVYGGMIFIGVMVQQLGGGTQLVGLASMTAALAEIPVMLNGPHLLKRFRAGQLVGFAMLMYVVREALYAVMQTAWWVVPINLMHLLTYGPLWIGSVAYANELAPDELKSTSQGMLFMIMNLATVLGAFVSGRLFDLIGARGLYAVLAGVCLAAFLIFTLGQRMLRKNEATAAA
jgi:PPP family 3-phenylpropionic acid transporter